MKGLIQDRLNEILANFNKIKPIMVIGDIGIDKYTSGVVRRISPEAPVPVLEVTKEWLKLGLSANVSHNLRTLDVDNSLCGVIGQDRNGDIFNNLLVDCQISHEGIIRTDSRPTTFKERIITNTQQICRVDYESSTDIDDKTEQNIINYIENNLENHSAIIIEDYGKGSLTENVVQKIISKANSLNVNVLVDPSRTSNPKIYKGAFLLKPNRQEAEIMVTALGFRAKHVADMGKILKNELNIKHVVITLGSEGMAIFEENANHAKMIPTIATEVFDVSGAGDTTISLLAASLASGATLEESSWIANCGAGIVVGKHGTATVNQNEIKAYYAKIVDYMEKGVK